MRAGQQLTNDQGVQIALFPLEYMNISQGEGGSYSHAGSYAMDFLGWTANGRKYKCPYYAPFDCHVVQHASYYNVWQSDNEVITPTGKKYVSFVVMHDDNPPALNTRKSQGEIIGHTGTRDSGTGQLTGDHVHLDGADGLFAGWMSGGKDLINRQHLYNLFYINDTGIINDYGYNWQIYNGGITPTHFKKYKFKWVLYANKLRSRNVK